MRIIEKPFTHRRLALFPALGALLLLVLCQARAAEPPGVALTNSPERDAPTSLTILRDREALAGFMATLDETKTLGSGDRVTYRVLEDLNPPKELTVGDSGELDVPYYGLVQAGKKTCRQLAVEIKRLLEKKNYRQATVIIMLEETNKKRILGKVYVSGQVHLSGPFEIPDDEVFTVSKAILKAGGFSDFADKRHVRLIRSGVPGQDPKSNRAIIINVQDILEKGKTDSDVRVQADDMINVPKRTVNF